MGNQEFKQAPIQQKMITYIVILIIIIYSSYLFIQNNRENNILRSSEKIYSNCKIINVRYNYYKTIGLRVDYEYSVAGKKYEHQDNFLFYYKDTMKYILKNRTMPIAYSKNYPEIVKILVNANELNKFDLKQPDSMNWITKYESHLYE